MEFMSFFLFSLHLLLSGLVFSCECGNGDLGSLTSLTKNKTENKYDLSYLIGYKYFIFIVLKGMLSTHFQQNNIAVWSLILSQLKLLSFSLRYEFPRVMTSLGQLRQCSRYFGWCSTLMEQSSTVSLTEFQILNQQMKFPRFIFLTLIEMFY